MADFQDITPVIETEEARGGFCCIFNHPAPTAWQRIFSDQISVFRKVVSVKVDMIGPESAMIVCSPLDMERCMDAVRWCCEYANQVFRIRGEEGAEKREVGAES